MEWYTSLSLPEQIYWGSAIVATVFFLIQMIMAFAGIDHDAADAVDAEMDNHSLGSQFFTLKSMLGFFMLFGWTGLGLLSMGVALWQTVLVSVVAGLIMMSLTAFIFYSMSRLTDSGTLKMKNAVGSFAEVYLPIPAARGGIGKVNLKVQGAIRELDAVTDDAEQIPTGGIVKVIDLMNDHILVVTNSR